MLFLLSFSIVVILLHYLRVVQCTPPHCLANIQCAPINYSNPRDLVVTFFFIKTFGYWLAIMSFLMLYLCILFFVVVCFFYPSRRKIKFMVKALPRINCAVLICVGLKYTHSAVFSYKIVVRSVCGFADKLYYSLRKETLGPSE